MSEVRHVKLFRNGRNQAVRIPVEFEMPGDSATMRKEGDRLVIEPRRTSGVLALLATWEPLDDDLSDFDEGGDPPKAFDL